VHNIGGRVGHFYFGVTDEVQAVAMFVVQTDPALSSWLDGMTLNASARKRREADSRQRTG